MTPLVERNTTIPTQKKQVFSTAADNQPAVTIRVFQGERKMAEQNKLIGQFDLDGIPPAPRGTPQIEVAFDIDADGILHVSAKDKASGKEQKIRIEASSGLTEKEIKDMIQDAELHKEEDKKRAETAITRNEADALAFRAQKALEEYGDKIPSEVKQDIQTHIDAVKKALEGEDVQKIQSAKEALEKHMQKIGEAMSKAQGAEGAASHAAHAHSQAHPREEAQEKEDIQEAEVEILDKDDQ